MAASKKSSSKPAVIAKKQSSKPSASPTTGRPGIENRDDLRVPVQMLVDYRGANGNYLFDFCKDLGVGGVFIRTESPMDLGSKLELTFTLPDSKETLKTKGEVIWVQPPINGRGDLTPGMGIQFAQFKEDQRKLLKDFVQRVHGDRFEAKVGKTNHLKSA